MTSINIVLDPVDTITVDALGKPGQRVFYIQGRKGEQTVSLIIEKIQLQSLIEGVSQFISEVSTNFPDRVSPDEDFNEESMTIQPPVDALFRVGDMGLAYDDDRDLVCIIARELDLIPEEDTEEDEGNVVRYWCTRGQLAAMAIWGASVITRGRPVCPQCLQPMEPEGHFCPKKNGHKKAVQD